jgi:hypothetical protein
MLDGFYEAEPGKLSVLSNNVAEYRKKLNEFNFRNWILERGEYSLAGLFFRIVFLVLLSPVFITGWICNIIPYRLPARFTKKIKDPQFLNSFRFVLALVIFLVFYALAGIITSIVTGPFWIPWAVMAGMSITGYMALRYTIWLKKLIAAVRFRTMKSQKNPGLLRLIELHKDIISEMNRLTEIFNQSLISREKMIVHEKF